MNNPHIDYTGKKPKVKREFTDELLQVDEKIFGIGKNANCIEISTQSMDSPLNQKYKDLIDIGFMKIRYSIMEEEMMLSQQLIRDGN